MKYTKTQMNEGLDYISNTRVYSLYRVLKDNYSECCMYVNVIVLLF